MKNKTLLSEPNASLRELELFLRRQLAALQSKSPRSYKTVGDWAIKPACLQGLITCIILLILYRISVHILFAVLTSTLFYFFYICFITKTLIYIKMNAKEFLLPSVALLAPSSIEIFKCWMVDITASLTPASYLSEYLTIGLVNYHSYLNAIISVFVTWGIATRMSRRERQTT